MLMTNKAKYSGHEIDEGTKKKTKLKKNILQI